MRSGLIAFALILGCGMAWAQGAPGSIEGRVTDSSGEGVPGANVVVEGVALTARRGATTDQEGRYRVGNLPAGTYAVSVSHIGFQQALLADVEVISGQARQVDVLLRPEVIFLDQNVVSASRRQEKILEAPASVSVVEAQEVRNRPTLTIAEHIRDLPAVDFAQTGLAQSNVVVRGFNNIFSGALLTLSDNRISHVPSLRLNAYNFIPITNEDVERIEVVLGPGSALYGPNSANGVMHIISRSPFTSQGTDLSLGMGERSLRKGSFRHAGTVGQTFGYKVSGQYYAGTDWKYSDPVEVGARQRALTGGADPEKLKIGARDFDLERMGGELRFDWKPTDDFSAIVSTGYNQANNVELTGLGAGQATDWVTGHFQARFLYRDWFAQIFRNWSDAGDTFLLRNGAPIVDKSTFTVYQIQHSASLGQRQRFTYGVDALLTRPDTDGTITGNNEGDDDINELGAYLQSETALSEKLDVVLALRYDDHNRIADAELSPRAGLVFKPSSTQTLRLTYNRAFSTPTTNNLYLDLVSSQDPFGLGRNFGASLGFQPNIDIRAQGTYRKGFDEGFTFARSASGQPRFRSPFAPVAGLGKDQYIDLHDPVFTNVMWGIGRGAVLAQFVPAFQQIVAGQLVAQGLDAATAQATAQQLAGGLPGIVPQQLAGLQNAMMELNLEKVSAGAANPFDPVQGVVDVRRTQPTITKTFELGYKGVIGSKLVVAADVYRTTTENFVGPLQVETPNVFLEPQALAGALAPQIGAALANPNNAQLATVLAALDKIQLPGVIQGNNNGSVVDELTTIFVQGAARIPYGTVSPEQAYDPAAIILTYRNFGEVTVNGLDLSLAYYPTDRWRLTGNYSLVDDNFFEDVDGIADIALNAPKNKLKLGSSYAFPAQGLEVGGQLRYSDSYRMDSGVYVGEVDSYAVLDLNLVYQLPIEQKVAVKVDIANVLNNEHREFVGAPEVGRMAFAQVGVSF